MTNKRGRPPHYTDTTKVALAPGSRARSRLQRDSDRRAVINLIIDNKGEMTIGEINEHFGFDISDRVRSLLRNNWLELVE